MLFAAGSLLIPDPNKFGEHFTPPSAKIDAPESSRDTAHLPPHCQKDLLCVSVSLREKIFL
jgi:hypothetical protein